jgi:hypothetical protein
MGARGLIVVSAAMLFGVAYDGSRVLGVVTGA